MNFTLIQTNTVTRTFDRIDPRTGKPEVASVTHRPGRVIARHNDKATTERHAARLRKNFPEVEFEVKESSRD